MFFLLVIYSSAAKAHGSARKNRFENIIQYFPARFNNDEQKISQFFPNREVRLFRSAAADAGSRIRKAGLQPVAHAQAHGRAQRHTVHRVGRDLHVDLEFLAQILRQAVLSW